MPYDFVLSDDEKRELLRIARASLREFLRSGRTPPGKPHRASLTANAGVFVSLHQGSELRGCVGNVEEDEPLYKAIQNMAVAAASRDPRFDPLTRDMLDEITIEVSVLGHRQPVENPGAIELGVHGVAVTSGPRRGLLLPQVATENNWDASTLVAHTCAKAGLDGEAWQNDGVRLEVFTAQVFDDKSHPPQMR